MNKTKIAYLKNTAAKAGGWVMRLGCVGVLAGTLFGCGAIEHAIDCHDICSRYSSCYDKSYDVDKCTDTCKDNAAHQSGYGDKAESCSDCIGDKSCASATFNCASQCAGIVP